MSKLEKPGYPLPSGELGEDEIVCQLVYLPDRDEYWQALLAAIHFMSTWTAWERDADKRGKDAATNWREAFELTIGCWRMTCLEDLTTTVTDILELLQTKKDCCDDNITYLPIEDIETDISPGEGDPPATYGETEVADWDEWFEYLCFTAHEYVDYLAHVGESLWDASRNSALAIGLIAALLALLAFSGIGLPIAFGLAATVVSAIVLGGTLLTFEDSKDDIEAAREEIVCSIMQNTGLADAVENALGSNTAWDLFYQFVPYDNALAVMYEGGHDGEYLEAVKRLDCDCEFDALFEYLFVSPDKENWTGSTRWVGSDLEFTASSSGIDAGVFSNDGPVALGVRFGISVPIVVNYVNFDFQFHVGTPPARYQYFYLRLLEEGGGSADSQIIYRTDYTDNQWYNMSWDVGRDLQLEDIPLPLWVLLRKTSSTPGDQGVLIRNLKYIYL